VTPFQDHVDEVDLVPDPVAGETCDRVWPGPREYGTHVSRLGEPARPCRAPTGTTGGGFMVRRDAARLRDSKQLETEPSQSRRTVLAVT
jgi:hypothetical protein